MIRARRGHCALMPPSLTTRPHLAISFAMNSPNSAGAHTHESAPSLRELLLHLGRFLDAAISLCSLSTMAAGVPAGATMPTSWRPRSRQPGFGDGRNVRKHGIAFQPRRRRAPAACRSGYAASPSSSVAKSSWCCRRPRRSAPGRRRGTARAAVSTPADELEQLGAEMHEAADAAGRILQLARLFLGERDELVHRLDRQIGIDRRSRSGRRRGARPARTI